jgi:hypothetical protein
LANGADKLDADDLAVRVEVYDLHLATTGHIRQLIAMVWCPFDKTNVADLF